MPPPAHPPPPAHTPPRRDLEPECGVCLERAPDCCLPCSHAFCGDCVLALLRRDDRKCPICRAAFRGYPGAPPTLQRRLAFLRWQYGRVARRWWGQLALLLALSVAVVVVAVNVSALPPCAPPPTWTRFLGAAADADPAACFARGRRLLLGQAGCAVDRDGGLAWMRRAAGLGFLDAQRTLAREAAAEHEAEAQFWMQRAAEGGDLASQLVLAPQDCRFARAAAANGGGGDAMLLLSRLLAAGAAGCEQSVSEAGVWLRRAAEEEGHVQAQYALGVALVAEDDPVGREWLERAAARGHAMAQTDLAIAFEHGHGGDVDNAAAAEWFRPAAHAGVVVAQSRLGWMLETGRGVPKDRGEALEWYERASEAGDADSMLAAAKLLSSASGSASGDEGRAVEFARRARAAGHPEAEYVLRKLLE